MHSAGSLPSGKALILGGELIVQGVFIYFSSTEIFDPSANAFHYGPNMSIGRWAMSVINYQNGLFVYGGLGGPPENVAEYYDPIAANFTTLPPSLAPISDPRATLLADGATILILGATAGPSTASELFQLTPVTTGVATTGAATTGIATTGSATTGVATTGAATSGIVTTGILSSGAATTGVITTTAATTSPQSTTGAVITTAAMSTADPTTNAHTTTAATTASQNETSPAKGTTIIGEAFKRIYLTPLRQDWHHCHRCFGGWRWGAAHRSCHYDSRVHCEEKKASFRNRRDRATLAFTLQQNFS
jgi:hypothetical protein